MKRTLILLISLLSLSLSVEAVSYADELVPGLNACVKKWDDISNPDNPNFPGMGEIRAGRLECHQEALASVDRKLDAAVEKAKARCSKKFPDFGDKAIAACKKSYDVTLVNARKFRDSMQETLFLHFEECPTCMNIDGVKESIKFTKETIKKIEWSAKSYLDDIK